MSKQRKASKTLKKENDVIVDRSAKTAKSLLHSFIYAMIITIVLLMGYAMHRDGMFKDINIFISKKHTSLSSIEQYKVDLAQELSSIRDSKLLSKVFPIAVLEKASESQLQRYIASGDMKDELEVVKEYLKNESYGFGGLGVVCGKSNQGYKKLIHSFLSSEKTKYSLLNTEFTDYGIAVTEDSSGVFSVCIVFAQRKNTSSTNTEKTNGSIQDSSLTSNPGTPTTTQSTVTPSNKTNCQQYTYSDLPSEVRYVDYLNIGVEQVLVEPVVGTKETCMDSNFVSTERIITPAVKEIRLVGTNIAIGGNSGGASTPQYTRAEANSLAQSNCARFADSSAYQQCISAYLRQYGY